ncbi:acetoacetate decarboxylase [Actinopolyspora erythraea]|uniref:Acetoacetate decarboxylase n=1 Tax=Actinopolyspora erythraea TaxID=414996 RepID=A0A099D734_9ACTN|nr:acetoacetate decarboxylase [Actinopolyspora erythraea]ASU78359.1 acetoacetate decarboxylase [Actinopolyspora erythraea]KGI81948.1 acetoacetate decarboxylase [Actinopolyspora erythraea]
MRAEQVRQVLTTPLTSPAFAATVPRFTDREYLNIVYRTDPDALRTVVPEPLEIDEPLVRFEIMRMNEVTSFGPYTEAGQAIPVRFGDERGEYLHAMYLDNFPATASGRELSAYPKVLAAPRLRTEHAALVGTLDYGNERVATATMGYKHHALPVEQAARQITVPTYMLDVLPGRDREPRVCELVRTEITDITVTQAWTAPARLQLFEHALAPLADLPVREVVSASHLLADLTLGPAVPVHDYLASA